MTATTGTAFTTTMRVVDRVLGDTAGQRLDAHPATTTGLAQVLVLVVRVRHGTDRSHAVGAQVTLLAAVETHDDHAAVTTDQLDVGTGCAGDLAALARLHFHVVADRTDRHLAEQHGVAGLGVALLGSDDLVADSETLRSEDVGQFAIGVLDQGDERG